MSERCAKHEMYQADCPDCIQEWNRKGRKELAEFRERTGEPAPPAPPAAPGLDTVTITCERFGKMLTDMEKLARAESELEKVKQQVAELLAGIEAVNRVNQEVGQEKEDLDTKRIELELELDKLKLDLAADDRDFAVIANEIGAPEQTRESIVKTIRELRAENQRLRDATINLIDRVRKLPKRFPTHLEWPEVKDAEAALREKGRE